jgi:uncharacterized protein
MHSPASIFLLPSIPPTDARRLGRRGPCSTRFNITQFLLLLMLPLFLLASRAGAAEVIPPSPAQYFNDYAHVVSSQVADQLNAELTQFERDTSNQIVVAIYPKMQSDSDIADYTVRIAQSWGVGQKMKKNGVVLFAFIQDRKLFIQVGYGLEGALPDATCKMIIDQEITPRFKTGDFDTGFMSGVQAIMAATKGEYKGTGATDDDASPAARDTSSDAGLLACIGSAIGAFVLFGLLLLVLHNFGGTFYQNHNRSLGFFENAYMFILGMTVNMIFSGGSGSSGGGGGSSGGGFSSGGGSFGGGGAGGSW